MSNFEKRYFYGASVQGIQDYIFQTNELKDIIGASDIVEYICTSLFSTLIRTSGADDDLNVIVKAAGNIKCIFESESLCRKVVREFPKMVVELAPGITISQAVVELDDDFAAAVDKLESLLKAKRNHPLRLATLGYIGMRRSRKTGLPATEEYSGEYMDKSILQKRLNKNGTKQLCDKMFGRKIYNREIAYDIKDITSKNDWIAIIHADGNGIGQVVKNIGKDKNKFADFSRKLSDVTVNSAKEAFFETIENRDENGRIPIRPVVLGGDDLTVIIRGDLALPFATSFIRKFEEKSKKEFSQYIKGNSLTACAGIAYIKSSYPFYYGYDLAELLCTRAKKTAKSLAENNSSSVIPSCLMIHKVQDSFVEDYDSIVERELTPCSGHSFEFGPYFINERNGYWTTEKLMTTKEILSTNDGNALKSHVRNWMSAMHDEGAEKAQQLSDRVIQRLKKTAMEHTAKELFEGVIRGEKTIYPAYDALALCSIENQVTR